MVKSMLCKAIQNRRQISMRYEGMERILDPYLIGTTTAGNEALRGYSESGGVPAWRLFTLSTISNVKILDTSFGIHPLCNPYDKLWYRSPAESRLDWNFNPTSLFGKRSIFGPALQFLRPVEFQ